MQMEIITAKMELIKDFLSELNVHTYLYRKYQMIYDELFVKFTELSIQVNEQLNNETFKLTNTLL